MKLSLGLNKYGGICVWLKISSLFCGLTLCLHGQNSNKTKSPWLGEWSGSLGNLGAVVLDIRDQGTGEPKSIAVWWLVEELRLSGQPRFEKETVFIDRLDHKFHSAPGLAFQLIPPDKIKLVPYGVLPAPLDPLLDGLILTQPADSKSRSQTILDHYKYSAGSKWHEGGNLKALPSNWPAAVATPTAILLSHGVHEFHAALVKSSVPASFLAEAYTLTQDKPVWGDQKDYVLLAIAQNPNTAAETLQKIWAEPENPQLWMAVAVHPTAQPEWRIGLVDRIMNSSEAIKHRAIWTDDGPPELYLRLIKESRSIREELASSHRMPPFVYETLARDYPDEVRGRLAGNESVPANIVDSFAGTDDRNIKFVLIQNKKLSPAIRHKLVLELAQSATMKELGRLSYDPDVPPEFLARCAKDLDPTIRSNAANNPQVNVEILRQLATDESAAVAHSSREILMKRFPTVFAEIAPTLVPLKNLDPDNRPSSLFRRALDRNDLKELARVTNYLRANDELEATMTTNGLAVIVSYRPEIMDFFLANGFNKYGLALVDLAGQCHGDQQWLTYFKAKGALTNKSAGRAFATALETRDIENVSGLITAGLDVNSTASYSMTALHRAVLLRNMTAVDLLLKAGARIDMVDERGQTPLTYAVQARLIPAIRLMDKEGMYAALIESFTREFPAAPASRFLGQWTNNKDGFSTVVLRLEPDGTGRLAASIASMLVAWHETSVNEAVAFAFNEKGEVERKFQITIRVNSEGTELFFEPENGEKQKMKRDKR